MIRRITILTFVVALTGCGPDYSPDTYATNAVQQANKVEQGTVVGVRDVAVSAAGTTGAVVGGAAGGIAGAQAGSGPVSAFAALGGTLVGGLAGSAVEHAAGDTRAFEYIVRKTGNDLVSVTQKDTTPLALGQHVLVIAGNQARVVPDYTVNLTPGAKEKKAAGDAPPAEAVPSAAGTPTDTAKPDDPAKPADPAAQAAAATAAPQASAGKDTSAGVVSDAARPAPAVGTQAAQNTASTPIRLTDPLPAPGEPVHPSGTTP